MRAFKRDGKRIICDEHIDMEGARVAARLGYELPEDWYEKTTGWWDAHRSSALESVDDHGTSPNEEDFKVAFEALEFPKEPQCA